MDWRHHAACVNEDPELFFPIGAAGPAQHQLEQAKVICHRCLVIDTCLAWSLESGQDAGVSEACPRMSGVHSGVELQASAIGVDGTGATKDSG